jgi:hypothetical protein
MTLLDSPSDDDSSTVPKYPKLFEAITALTVDKYVDKIATTNPSDVQTIAASQIGLLVDYHQIVQAQSRRSFDWALIGPA